jgi:hypothetical protein
MPVPAPKVTLIGDAQPGIAVPLLKVNVTWPPIETGAAITAFGATVAVNVTTWPTGYGLVADASVVLVFSGLTTSAIAGDVMVV